MDHIRIDTIDFKDILPGWMREDDIDVSLADSISDYIHKLAEYRPALEKWTDGAVEAMGEKYLDALAYELNITWYLYDAPIEQKRAIIKQARQVHWKIGTKWAIKYVLSTYFISAQVIEWHEYSGTNGHFRIETEYPELYNNTKTFIKILNSVKRASQHLDSVDLVNEVSVRPRKGCYSNHILCNSIVCSN